MKNTHRKLTSKVGNHNLHGECIKERLDVFQKNFIRLRIIQTVNNDIVHNHHNVLVSLRNQKESVICNNIRGNLDQLGCLHQIILIKFRLSM